LKTFPKGKNNCVISSIEKKDSKEKPPRSVRSSYSTEKEAHVLDTTLEKRKEGKSAPVGSKRRKWVPL